MSGVAGRSGGRNAKTTEEHRLQGTHRQDRHGDGENPEPPRIKPDPPKTLTGEALVEWDLMVGRLSLSRTLTLVDDAVLYQYCKLYAETEAIALLQEETAGSIDIMEDNLAGLKGPDLVAAFQEITKLRALEARYTTQIRQGRMGIRSYLVELGQTPAARSRVKVTKAETPKSKWAGIL